MNKDNQEQARKGLLIRMAKHKPEIKMSKIKKGQLLQVNHSRSGNWKGRAYEDFDTEKDEWYSIILVDEFADGLNTSWEKGEKMPARRGLCRVTIIEEKLK